MEVDRRETTASQRWSNADDVSFTDLMSELLDGSEAAAWKIIDSYTPHVMRVVRASLPLAIRSKVDSIDIANTLFGSLLIKRHRLAGIKEPAQLMALLTKAARNRVIEEHRKYTVCAARDIDSEEGLYDEAELAKAGVGSGVAGDGRLGGRENTPSQIAIAREKWRCVLEGLSPRDREIVLLKVGGKNYKQIAELVPGISERSVRRVVSMAVKQLMR